MKMRTMMISLVCLLQMIANCLYAQSLTLKVEGIEKVEGKLYVALYNSKETFMKKPCAAFVVDVKDKVMTIPCKGLPTGAYAASMYQDENGNERLDTAAFGMPTEKYGFSNDAKGTMGPPSYEKCCFTFAEDMLLTVHLE